MPETHDDCTRFENWLLEEHDGHSSQWHAHLETCSSCREQWTAHQMLIATYAEESVPELSPAFQAGLDRKLEAAVRVEPLKGWRLAALVTYALAAVGFFTWILQRFPLPSISIDASSPWVSVAALVAVPLTLWLTAAMTRLLPSPRPRGLRTFAL